jgi:hypothetical protein
LYLIHKSPSAVLVELVAGLVFLPSITAVVFSTRTARRGRTLGGA